jgi:hypothetical protein
MGGTFNPIPNASSASIAKTVAAIQDAQVDPASKSTLPKELGIQELLAWLATQLESSDRAIRAQMTALSNSKDQVAALASIKTAFEALKSTPGDPKTIADDDPLAPNMIKGSDWYKNLADGDPIKKTVDAYIAKCTHGSTGGVMGWSIKGDDLKNASDTFTDQISAATSRNEMDMIKLQSAISARGQMIQLISNMTASFNETLKNVAANIRA